MKRIHSGWISCIAAGALLFGPVQSHAAGGGPLHPVPGANPAASNSAAPQEEKWSTSFNITGAQHAVFNFAAGAPGRIRINIQSQGEPVSRFLVKPSGEAVFISDPAAFEYMITAEDLSRGNQWKVDIYLAPGNPRNGGARFNPNGRASGSITMLHPPAGGNSTQAGAGGARNVNMAGAGSAAAHVTDQPPPAAPVIFGRIALARRPGELTPAPVNIANRFEASRQAPIRFRPFVLAEVFDLRTGKPLFAVNENTGELPLPHGAGITVYHGVRPASSDLQSRGVRDFSVAQGGAYRLRTVNGRQFVTVPRGDGTSITVPAEAFLSELNAYEQGLNAHGISLRDANTGKIASSPTTITASRLHVDTLMIKQQRIDHDRRIVKGITPRPWGSAEIFQLHQKAMEHMPAVLRGPNNRLISASLPLPPVRGRPHAPPSGNPSVAGTRHVLPGNRSAQLGNRIAQPVGTAPGAVVDRMQKCVLAQDPASQPAGGLAGDAVTINVAKYDPNACYFSFTDSQGRQVDIPSVSQISATQVSLRIPAGVKGMGSIDLRTRSSPYIGSVPYYVGPECSLDSAYPAIGMAGTEVTLKVGRFNNCELRFSDGMALTAVTYTVVDGNTVTIKVPNFSIGNDRIEAARHPGPGQSPTVSSALDFTLQRTVFDVNGNPPPPDYFAQGIQPFDKTYPWHQLYGDPSNFAVEIYAALEIYSDGKTKPPQGKRPEGGDQGDNQVIFYGEGKATGWLFNYSADLIDAQGVVSVPTATSSDSKMRANFRIATGDPKHQVVIYQWHRDKDKDKDDGAAQAQQNSCPADQMVGGKCCDDIKPDGTCADDGFAVQAQIKYNPKPYEVLNVDQSVSTEFPLGPVWMVARFGFHGHADVGVKFAASPLQIVAQVKPHAYAKVYGECGVDLFFANAGVGVDMVLAEVTLDSSGQIYLDFGQMALVGTMYIDYDYDFLDGSIYVFVDGFGFRVKQTLFDINEVASQVTGQNFLFKGHNYLLAPQTYALPLLSHL